MSPARVTRRKRIGGSRVPSSSEDDDAPYPAAAASGASLRQAQIPPGATVPLQDQQVLQPSDDQLRQAPAGPALRDFAELVGDERDQGQAHGQSPEREERNLKLWRNVYLPV